MSDETESRFCAQWQNGLFSHFEHYRCHLQDITNNAWVAVNNYFGSRVRRFADDFHEWRSHEWNHRQIASRVTQRSLFTVTNILFYFLHAILCPRTHFYYKPSSIAHFATVAKDGLFWLRIVTSSQLICDVTRTRNTSIVTSYSAIVLARANWHKSDLHWWITIVNIDFSSPGNHKFIFFSNFVNVFPSFEHPKAPFTLKFHYFIKGLHINWRPTGVCCLIRLVFLDHSGMQRFAVNICVAMLQQNIFVESCTYN